MKEVAIYLRKSREDEEDKELTLDRHERILVEYCNKNDLIIRKIYKEIVSGGDLEHRPQAKQMLNDVKNNEYDGVVVIELERLSRGNSLDQATILDIFKKSNTLIYTLNKVYNLSDEDNEFDEEFFEFGLFMSRREYKIIKRRLIRGKQQAMKEGYYTGSVLPFGFDKLKQEKGFVLVPNDKIEVVKMIFNEFVNNNKSAVEIRDILNKEGIKTAKGDNWSQVLIKRVLKNKVYIGKIANNRRATNNVSWYEGKHKAVIDEEIFKLAQNKLNIPLTRTKLTRNLLNPFASILKCKKCGRNLHYLHNPNKNNRVYLRCTNVNCKTVGSDFYYLEKRIIDELKQELTNYQYYIDNFDDEVEKKEKQIEEEKALLKKEIIKKENMINKVCEMLEEGIYTKEKYLERTSILNKEISALKSAIKDLENNHYEEYHEMKTKIPILEKVLDEYWGLKPKEKNELLKAIVDKIYYTKDRACKRGKVDETNNLKLEIYLKI